MVSYGLVDINSSEHGKLHLTTDVVAMVKSIVYMQGYIFLITKMLFIIKV
jgi:hypothetical protein